MLICRDRCCIYGGKRLTFPAQVGAAALQLKFCRRFIQRGERSRIVGYSIPFNIKMVNAAEATSSPMIL
jgi:hypothetical protein